MDATLIIDGTRRTAASGEVIPVHSPATPSQVVGTIPRGDAADVDLAVQAAQAAFAEWAATPVSERITALTKAADAISPHVDSLAEQLTLEMGKIRTESLADIATADFMVRYLSAEAAGVVEAHRLSDELGTVTVEHRPIGVVGIIVPWNWPPAILSVRLAEALSTGNTVVCIPSPFASIAVVGCVELMAAVLPPGVLNVVTGYGPEAGAALTAHPAVRKISFTGGAKTGREVMRASAGNFKTIALELGGNDAAIILDDVQVDDQLAAALIEASLSTTGQICMAAKRVYVASSKFDDVVEAFTEAASRIVVGDGMDPSVTMGPLVNAAQATRFDGIIRDAWDRGGTVSEVGSLADGLDPGGYYRLPQIVTGLDASALLVSDEQFGPATPFIPFDDVDDALAQANDTEFGLGGSVWSADVDRARAVGRRVEAGMVFINRHNVPAVHPLGIFGGVKQSGIGRELGRWGLESYTETCEIVDPAPTS